VASPKGARAGVDSSLRYRLLITCTRVCVHLVNVVGIAAPAPMPSQNPSVITRACHHGHEDRGDPVREPLHRTAFPVCASSPARRSGQVVSDDAGGPDHQPSAAVDRGATTLVARCTSAGIDSPVSMLNPRGAGRPRRCRRSRSSRRPHRPVAGDQVLDADAAFGCRYEARRRPSASSSRARKADRRCVWPVPRSTGRPGLKWCPGGDLEGRWSLRPPSVPGSARTRAAGRSGPRCPNRIA